MATSLNSIIIQPNKQVSDVFKMLVVEIGKADNIKDAKAGRPSQPP
jgi:peptide subunit release factor 1 (eRF1)